MRKKDIKIAFVIKTDGLEYDDRLRKEILSMQKLYPQIYIKIFVMLPNNRKSSGVTTYGVPYESVYISARDKYPSGTMTALKSFEFYKAIKKAISDYDVVWCANDDVAMIVAFVKNKTILWDLHELPSSMLSNPLKRLLLRYLFSRCHIVIHANSQRMAFLERIGTISNVNKHYVLRNFPDFKNVDQRHDEKLLHFLEWKADRTCVYLQGLTNDSRAAFESVSAIMSYEGLSAVIVGNFDHDSKMRLLKVYGDKFEERILFIGKIPQMEIPKYVERCDFSIILYKNVRPNNLYCEANRFYQSIVMGLPVIVGNNPPMKELVEMYQFGVSIDDDGNSIDKIREGIDLLLANYDVYHQNCIEYKDKLIWESQESVISEFMNVLLE